MWVGNSELSVERRTTFVPEPARWVRAGRGGAGRDGRETDEALDPAVRFGAWELLETKCEL